MVIPVTASTSSTPAAPSQATPPANLDAELAKCQSQLADWVHCESGKTPEGKAKIEEISSKIDALKSKIEQSNRARETDGPAASAPPQSVPPVRKPLSLDGLGGYVDEHA